MSGSSGLAANRHDQCCLRRHCPFIRIKRIMNMLNWMKTRRPRPPICSGLAAAVIRMSLVAGLAWCVGSVAAAASELYRAQTIVTGQSEPNRSIGFAACLEDVLIKVSGALQLAGDP